MILYIVKLVSFWFNSLNVTKLNKLGSSYKPRELDTSPYMSVTLLMKFKIMTIQHLLTFFLEFYLFILIGYNKSASLMSISDLDL